MQAVAYLRCENVRVKAIKRCLQLAEAVNDCRAFSIMSHTFMAKRHMLPWQGNDLLHERAGNFL